jgi:hypothetical protein
LDADGDGTVVGQTAECLPLPLPPGYTTSPHYYADCDDSDPELQTRRYWDGDGDGYAPPDAEATCLPMEQRDPHYVVAPGGDCDDADPLVNGGMPEQRGDGVDSNCDGFLDPVGCAGGNDTDDTCSCSAHFAVEDPKAPGGCAGQPDLYLDHVLDCTEECVGTVGAILAVGNRGEAAYSGWGTVVLRDADGASVWAQPVSIDIGPGDVQYLGAPFGFQVMVELSAPGDCDGGTVAVPVYQSFIDCFF